MATYASKPSPTPVHAKPRKLAARRGRALNPTIIVSAWRTSIRVEYPDRPSVRASCGTVTSAVDRDVRPVKTGEYVTKVGPESPERADPRYSRLAGGEAQENLRRASHES